MKIDVYRQVELIKAMEGNPDRIDTKEEFEKLSDFLSKNDDKMTDEEKSYVKGLMIEYLDGGPTASETIEDPSDNTDDNTDARTDDSQPAKGSERNNPTTGDKLSEFAKAAIVASAPFLALPGLLAKGAKIAKNLVNTEK